MGETSGRGGEPKGSVVKIVTRKINHLGQETVSVRFKCTKEDVFNFQRRRNEWEGWEEFGQTAAVGGARGGRGGRSGRSGRGGRGGGRRALQVPMSDLERKQRELEELQRQDQQLTAYQEVLSTSGGQQLYRARTVQTADGKKQSKCSRCGMPGHSASSKQCPMYQRPDEVANNDAVRVDGLKLKVRAGDTGVVAPGRPLRLPSRTYASSEAARLLPR